MTQNKLVSIVGIVGFTILTGVVAFGLSSRFVPSPLEANNLYRPDVAEVTLGVAEIQTLERALPSRLGQELDIYLPPILIDESIVDLQSLDIATQTEMVTQDYARGLHMNCGGY